MIESVQLTTAQRRRFYREAVRETLMSMYGKSESDSEHLVAGWWKRALESGDVKSDMFFHSEPLHVAADIADVQSIDITAKNEEAYRASLDRASKRVLERSNLLQAIREEKAAVKKQLFVVREELATGGTRSDAKSKGRYAVSSTKRQKMRLQQLVIHGQR